MANNKNFGWLTQDIDSTLILKVIYKTDDITEEYGVFNVVGVFETTGDNLDIKTANIDDLTNFLTLGIVRFANVGDNSDVLDIPFRKLYLLYMSAANILEENSQSELVPFSELDTFSVIDGTVRNEMFVFSAIINDVSEDLLEVMRIAYEFGNYGMQEKFNALSDVTLINHRRLMRFEKEKMLR